jgi:hypothetical protein
MKKLFLLIGVAFLVSCATTGSVGVVHDPSIPVEQSALISPSDIGEIIGYNGTAVNWKLSRTELVGQDIKFIQIPAGNTILEWNISTILSDDPLRIYGYTVHTLRGKNILFAYNFRSQRKYYFMATVKDEKYGLNIYAYNLDEKIEYSREDYNSHFEAFAPFLNAGGPNNRIILE